MTPSLLYYHQDHLCGTAKVFLMLLRYYCCTLLDYTSTSQHFISLRQPVNGAQFLNITYLLFLSAAIAAACAPCPTTVIIPFTSMCASL